MKIILAGALVFACASLSGCIVASAAGAAVGVTGAVVGGAVDLVTTSDEEQMKKDIKEMKKQNKARNRAEK